MKFKITRTSAWREEKPCEEAQNGDWVITSELSRIGRSTTDVLQTLNTLAKKGVNVYFVKQAMQLDQSPMGKMMTAILSAFAEMERDLISQRTIEGIERARREGKHIGRPVGKQSDVFKMKEEELRVCRRSGMSKSQISRCYNIHRQTVNKYMKMWGIA